MQIETADDRKVSDVNPLPVKAGTLGASTGTQSNVNDTNVDSTILAANAARRGAAVWNDSTQVLYLLLAAGTASATNCTVKVAADGYYEVPASYSGVIKGVWAADASGAARVTEWS